jgi:hypothetical protein
MYIKFEYKDRYTNEAYKKQECICDSLSECILLYGLGYDCDYRILEVK